MAEGRAIEILDTAWDLGVRAFDTAERYGSDEASGEAARRLRSWLESRSRMEAACVVTKTPPGAPDERVALALDRFAGALDLTLLTHGAASPSQWEAVCDAAEGAGAKVGQSVYDDWEVRAAVQLAGVSRVQAPGNVFDLRALAARGTATVSLDLRSVYLQGILLDAPDAAERRVAGGGRLAAAVTLAAADAAAPAASLLVAAVLHELGDGDRVVIGVDAPEQVSVLKEATALPKDATERFMELALEVAGSVSRHVLDPRRW
jgi:aryl-alcohol dehydrogenase-like predicted oxidoreductase